MKLRLIGAAVVVALAGTAAGIALTTGGDRASVTLVTHDSFNISSSVLREFTRQTDVEVEVLRAGDAGQVLNQAILTEDHPLGDVLFGVDNTFLSRALDNEIFERYESPALEHVPDRYTEATQGRATPVDRGDVCVNYDEEWFAERGVAPPERLEDLTRPEYRGLLVVENPATSSPGLAFLLATIARFGEDGWAAYWADLRANDVLAVDGWEQAWFEHFTAASDRGERPLVVSYASSPPATVPEDGGPARAAALLDTCFQQIEYAGVLRGTERPRAARDLVDFMLSERFQQDMPLQMFVFPVREGIELPELFAEHAAIAEDPLAVPPGEIEQHRDRWIDEWTEVVVR